MTDPLPFADAAITYGPTGVRCGCGRDAHSNLSPCREEEVADPAPYCPDVECAADGCSPAEPCCVADGCHCVRVECMTEDSGDSRWCRDHQKEYLP